MGRVPLLVLRLFVDVVVAVGANCDNCVGGEKRGGGRREEGWARAAERWIGEGRCSRGIVVVVAQLVVDVVR